MCVDDRRKVDLSGVDLFLQYRRNSSVSLSLMVVSRVETTRLTQEGLQDL